MNPKVLFVLLVLCAIFLAVGLTLGFVGPDAQFPDSPPDWVEGLGKTLVKKEPLKTKDIQSAMPSECQEQFLWRAFVLSPGTTCTLIVKESSLSVRTLPLRLVQGMEVGVRFDSPDKNSLGVKQTLKPDRRTMDVSIFKVGGVLEIRCMSGGSEGGDCRIEIE